MITQPTIGMSVKEMKMAVAVMLPDLIETVTHCPRMGGIVVTSYFWKPPTPRRRILLTEMDYLVGEIEQRLTKEQGLAYWCHLSGHGESSLGMIKYRWIRRVPALAKALGITITTTGITITTNERTTPCASSDPDLLGK